MKDKLTTSETIQILDNLTALYWRFSLDPPNKRITALCIQLQKIIDQSLTHYAEH